MTRSPIADLPFWPRYLSREEAARYVGAPVSVFVEEVRRGVWPPGFRRGGRNGRLTWDRVALDHAADRAAGLEGTAEPAPSVSANSERDAAYWLERIEVTSRFDVQLRRALREEIERAPEPTRRTPGTARERRAHTGLSRHQAKDSR